MRNNVTEDELNILAVDLFNKLPVDIYNDNNVNSQDQIGHKFTIDMSTERLSVISSSILKSTATVKQMQKLYNNYKQEIRHEDYQTNKHDADENEFISTLLETEVMRYAMEFLAEKGFIEHGIEEYKRILKLLWFHSYFGPSKENKNDKKSCNKITRFHSWLYFVQEELSERLKYLGFARLAELHDKVDLADLVFQFDGADKTSTMFVGTPPEVEIALFTVCFYVNPGRNCRFCINGIKFTIMTYSLHIPEENVTVISAAYPLFAD